MGHTDHGDGAHGSRGWGIHAEGTGHTRGRGTRVKKLGHASQGYGDRDQGGGARSSGALTTRERGTRVKGTGHTVQGDGAQRPRDWGTQSRIMMIIMIIVLVFFGLFICLFWSQGLLPSWSQTQLFVFGHRHGLLPSLKNVRHTRSTEGPDFQ